MEVPRLNTKIRYWEYYDLQETFDQLFTQSKNGKKFYQLYELIISENNILLAYRTIKANKGLRHQERTPSQLITIRK